MLIKSYLGKVEVHNCDSISSVGEVIDFVRSRTSLPCHLELRCHQNGRMLSLQSPLPSLSSPVSVFLAGGLPGGKGGFGSLLRSIGAQIEKTTNHEAMRDLSGRRQRDVNNEERLKKFVAGRAEREKEAREKKQLKLEKLKRLAEGENKDKLGFSDPVYDKVRSETEEKVHDAVEAAFAASSGSGNNARSSDTNQKRKSSEVEPGPATKKAKGLWLGGGLDDLEDSDLTDSEEEEEASAVASSSK